MEFEKRKESALAAMIAPVPDKSPKGTLDAPIVPLLDTINRHPSFFTTSSCSGRISILSHPPEPQPTAATGEESTSDSQNVSETKEERKGEKKKKKAGGGSWLLVTHDPVEPQSVVDLLFGDGAMHSGPAGGTLVFRFEPFILAVECRDAVSAQLLVSTAISCGFRESGITSLHKRIMVAIRCSIRLELPLGEIGRMMVPPEYVIYLVKFANEKMKANRKRTDCFFQALQCESAFCLAINDSRSRSTQVNVDSKGDLSVPKVKQTKQLCNDAETCSGLHESNVEIMDGSLSSSTKKSNLSCELEDQIMDETESGLHSGLPRAPEFALSVKLMMIVGEPIEKLFIWGHSACTFNKSNQSHILLFGGFGGLGRHARRNNTLLLDPGSGLLREINAQGLPSPRLGHTSSVVGRHVFVIGGRGDPTQIFNDVWTLDTVENRWMLLECSGSVFHRRHRHAAAVIGSNIYVFGGISDETIYSCMHVLDSETMQWSEVEIRGEWPCARHSHASVAHGSQLFMFGGYDGQRALGDLYTFDVRTFSWKILKTPGRAPFPRFSHSMFLYENYLGIIGGCPVRQHHQEVALLHLVHHVWRYIIVDSVDKGLWVRSSVNIVDNDLIVVGGGASCYAFGTKFNHPMKISLCSLLALSDCNGGPVVKCGGTSNNCYNSFTNFWNSISVTNEKKSQYNSETTSDGFNLNNISGLAPGDIHLLSEYAVLQLEKRYAKLAKDILKKFGWLDLERKVEPSQDGLHILLPISIAFFEKIAEVAEILDILDGHNLLESFTGRGFSMNEICLPRALNILLACGTSILNDNEACSRKIHKCPRRILRDAVCSLMHSKGVPPELLDQVPTRWEHLGDIVIFPVTSFKDPMWNTMGEDLWLVVAESLGARRLARQGRILPTGTRDSTLEILVGESGWVTHHENGIIYSFDATKCMFSSGNFSEKLRMAQLDCKDEVIVDLFAGIGYFVLPFLVKAKARFVYACEWNLHALEALRHNLKMNLVAERCCVLEGDNQMTAPKGVADRVCLGLLPSSEGSWLTAVRALRPEGGILHIHGNVNDSEEKMWVEYVVTSIANIAKLEGYSWDVTLQHLERVKWYGPHIRHLVADVQCKAL